ncbi:unnamed protein product [Strongylus vulgaris]|uniref:Uncharacterized protein n=1 Tax=Strongylus vulgaris TaxID=40348 RepID=A0A3P7IWV4_STRVU|nr:unnamed protein product [Strongylus vulgaris]
MDKKSSRALMLILTTFTYLLLGAAVFDVLESETERYVREEIAFVQEKLHRKDMQLFESVAIKSIPHKAGYQWQFTGAFYFATVVITTVGRKIMVDVATQQFISKAMWTVTVLEAY